MNYEIKLVDSSNRNAVTVVEKYLCTLQVRVRPRCKLYEDVTRGDFKTLRLRLWIVSAVKISSIHDFMKRCGGSERTAAQHN